MKRLILLLVIAVVCLGLAGCDNWKTTTTPAFSVSLPDTPSKQVVQFVGIGSVDNYILSTKDPQCIVSIIAAESWPGTFDDGLVYTMLWPLILGNLGSKNPTDLVSVNGFMGKEYLADNGKTVARIYLQKPGIRIIKIDNQTATLNKDFTKRVFDSFKPIVIPAQK